MPPPFDYVLILATLIIDETNSYEYFCHKYKVSHSIKNRLKDISLNIEKLKNKKFYLEENIKKNIYLLNKDCVIDLLLISIVVNNKIKNENIEKLINYVNKYATPKFPVSGNDLKKYGYEDGVQLGKKLKELEEKWINNGFIIDKDFIEGSLDKVKKN